MSTTEKPRCVDNLSVKELTRVVSFMSAACSPTLTTLQMAPPSIPITILQQTAKRGGGGSVTNYKLCEQGKEDGVGVCAFRLKGEVGGNLCTFFH